MNYRHHFHAGNFADLLKHALLLAVLDLMQETGEPVSVFDTHAGAGRYDLEGEAARRSGEAEAGVVRLAADPDLPDVLGPLRAAVEAENRGGALRSYPGSPLLVVRALAREGRYTGCELRLDDFEALRKALAPFPSARAVRADGYAALEDWLAVSSGPRLVLIDPPFERGDDYQRAVAAAHAAHRCGAATLVWTPLKDLETFDAFLGGIEAFAAAGLVAEVRLGPLDNPLKMNGCAVTLVAPPLLPEALLASATTAARWIAHACGGEGAQGKATVLG